VLDEVDRALVELVAHPGDHNGLEEVVDLLTDTLLSHFAYEEHASCSNRWHGWGCTPVSCDGAGGRQFDHTTSAPTQVERTATSRIPVGSIAVGSLSSTTKSASCPGTSLPFVPASPVACAEPCV
jgi:hypothetical protein